MPARIKIGTQMDEAMFHRLKMAAAHEKRPMADLVQDAVAGYLARPRHGSTGGLSRLLASAHFQADRRKFRDIMEADYWDQ